MSLTSVPKLHVLGFIVSNYEKDGWCYKGSAHIAAQLSLQPEDVQLLMQQLCHDGYLIKKEVGKMDKIIPVKASEKANRERVKHFQLMFKDIKSMLLTKG